MRAHPYYNDLEMARGNTMSPLIMFTTGDLHVKVILKMSILDTNGHLVKRKICRWIVSGAMAVRQLITRALPQYQGIE